MYNLITTLLRAFNKVRSDMQMIVVSATQSRSAQADRKVPYVANLVKPTTQESQKRWSVLSSRRLEFGAASKPYFMSPVIRKLSLYSLLRGLRSTQK